MAQQTVVGNGSQQLILQMSNPKGIRLAWTATTPADITVAVLQNTIITASLRREGKTTTIMNGNALALGVSDLQSTGDGLVVNGEFTACYVPFAKLKRDGLNDMGVVNLRKDDQLIIQVSTSSAATGQQVTFSDQQGTGPELYTPEVSVYVINRNQSIMNVPLPGYVDGIAVVNSLEEYGLLNMNLQCSDPAFFMQDNVADFRSKLSQSISGGQAANPTFYSWSAYEGAPLCDASLTVGVDTTDSGNTYIVIYGGNSSPSVMANAARTLAKIQRSNARKFLGR